MESNQFTEHVRKPRCIAIACMLGFAAGAASGEPPLTDLAFLPGDVQLGSAIQKQADVDIAAGGPGYLVVWTDERAVLSGYVTAPESELSGNMQDIYGQLLDAQGEPIGDPIVIANQGRNQKDPAVAWNGSMWFVAFEGDQPDWYFNNNIYGVRVGADGTVLDAEPILLFSEIDNQGAYDPAVTSDGENWLVVCDQYINSTITVVGRRIAPDGTALDSQPVSMMQVTGAFYPDVAFADGVYMVVKQKSSGTNIYAQRFDANLSPLSTAVVIGQGSSQGRAKIASNGSRFMVVSLNAQRIEPDGTVLDPTGTSLTFGGSKDVAWTGAAWAVSSRIGIETAVSLQRVSDDGTLIDQNPITIEPSFYLLSETAIAGSGSGDAQVAYATRDFSLDDISSARVDVSGGISAKQVITIGLPRQTNAQFVQGPPGEHMVIFTSASNDEHRVMTQRLSDDGTPLDAEPTLVADGLPVGVAKPSIAWNGDVYLVTWTFDGNVVGRRLSADNQPLDAQPFTIIPAEGYALGGVAAAGATFVVGVFHYIPFHEPVRYAEWIRVSGSGDVLDSSPTLAAGGFSREMTAASMGDKAILAWAQYGIHDSPTAYVQSIIVDAAGNSTTAFSVSAQFGKEPDIAFDGTRSLIVWHDDTTIHQDNIEGRFVMPDGSMPVAEFDISTAVNEQMFPAVGFDGEQFVVAWNDYRHIDGIEQARADIRAARVTTDGTVLDPDGIAIADSSLPEDLPAVTGASGHAIIMFSALHGLNDVPEIQRLGYRVLGTPVVFGDVDGDGAVGVTDLLAVINAWGSCSPPPAQCAADVNGDGSVNVADLLIVINNWT